MYSAEEVYLNNLLTFSLTKLLDNNKESWKLIIINQMIILLLVVRALA